MSFAHLHTHSEYSLLDGLAKVDDLVSAAERMEQPALALTDHGSMSGAIAFYQRAKESSVKPIIGCEVYTCPDRHEKSRYGHLTLLAENLTGYKNLIALSTAGYLDGFYRKPRVDLELLERYNEGIICLSGCMASDLSQAILNELPQPADIADAYRQIFPGRYYLEIQDHGLDDDVTLVGHTHLLSRDLGLPLVATNDAHYVRRDQAPIHEILLCVQTQTTMEDPKRMRFETQEFYLKSGDEMAALFARYPESLSNTIEIADRCHLELDFGRAHLPAFPTPNDIPSIDYLRELVYIGLNQRYDNETIESVDAWKQAQYELSVIDQTGFADYFLLVWDVIRYARKQGIAVGPGRGSGAGAIVAYCLFITGVDPLKYELSFERFLNPERISMPDMDLDFADNRRSEVVDYVTNRYGSDHVAGIITLGTIGVRAGIRDIFRATKRPFDRADELAKLVPLTAKSVDQALRESPELADEVESDADAQIVLEMVKEVTGVARHASKHAAGIVISKDPLTEHVPLAKNKADIVTQYDMGSIDALGLLKMDFLGLRTLSIIDLALKFIENGPKSGEKRLLAEDIPLDDPKICQLLSAGDTFGVFQVESYGMRKLLRELKPTEFRHIVALISLYRPGPMQYLDQFVARRHGIERVTYAHPAVEQALADTYGIIVYQEQVMQIAVALAGYTMGQADLLRKAMGKKKPEIMVKERQTFIDRCVAHGTNGTIARQIFDDIEPFAGYAYNRAHATSYAFLTAQTAWLKVYYPKEFMAAVLTCESSNTDTLREAVQECRRLKIKLLDPDVNASDVFFRPDDGGIRYGLASLPNISKQTCELIVDERANGPYISPIDLCSRLGGSVVNKRVMESLIQCRAMDTLMDRQLLMARLDQIMAFGQAMHKARESGQRSLFDEPIVVDLTPEEEEQEDVSGRTVSIDIGTTTRDEGISRLVSLYQTLQDYPGTDEVEVIVPGATIASTIQVRYCDELESRILSMF